MRVVWQGAPCEINDWDDLCIERQKCTFARFCPARSGSGVAVGVQAG